MLGYYRASRAHPTTITRATQTVCSFGCVGASPSPSEAVAVGDDDDEARRERNEEDELFSMLWDATTDSSAEDVFDGFVASIGGTSAPRLRVTRGASKTRHEGKLALHWVWQPSPTAKIAFAFGPSRKRKRLRAARGC